MYSTEAMLYALYTPSLCAGVHPLSTLYLRILPPPTLALRLLLVPLFCHHTLLPLTLTSRPLTPSLRPGDSAGWCRACVHHQGVPGRPAVSGLLPHQHEADHTGPHSVLHAALQLPVLPGRGRCAEQHLCGCGTDTVCNCE